MEEGSEGAAREAGVVILALIETYRQEFGFTSSSLEKIKHGHVSK
jgi:hypothetical protein